MTIPQQRTSDLQYAAPGKPSCVVISESQALRSEVTEDLGEFNFSEIRSMSPADIDADNGQFRPNLLFADFPNATGPVLETLEKLSRELASRGCQFIVSTTLNSLDMVYASTLESEAQILISPTRAERIVAIATACLGLGSGRVRELSEDDRMTFIRLSEQVGRLAEKLDKLGEFDAKAPNASSAFTFGGRNASSSGTTHEVTDRLVRNVRPPLPDPRLVRKIIQQRQLRARFFDGDLFGDPAWDMLLDLTAARVEHVRVSVTSLCIASGVPPTTALRWISQMTESGLLERLEDETDRRRAFIQLTERAVDAMGRYFEALGRSAAQLT